MILIKLYNLKTYNKVAGLGIFQKKKIMCLLGLKFNFLNLESNKYSITKDVLNSIYVDCITNNINVNNYNNIYNQIKISNILLDYNSKIDIYNNIKILIQNNSYKGFCHKNALPVNGQRTKTNRNTQKSLGNLRLKKPKKNY
jgi:ribosomal protein S13